MDEPSLRSVVLIYRVSSLVFRVPHLRWAAFSILLSLCVSGPASAAPEVPWPPSSIDIYFGTLENHGGGHGHPLKFAHEYNVICDDLAEYVEPSLERRAKSSFTCQYTLEGLHGCNRFNAAGVWHSRGTFSGVYRWEPETRTHVVTL